MCLDLGVQSKRNCGSHAVTCSLQIISYQKKVEGCKMVCLESRAKRYFVQSIGFGFQSVTVLVGFLGVFFF